MRETAGLELSFKRSVPVKIRDTGKPTSLLRFVQYFQNLK
jgi:hypothetical protein